MDRRIRVGLQVEQAGRDHPCSSQDPSQQRQDHCLEVLDQSLHGQDALSPLSQLLESDKQHL
jgi:hypothetical protein